MLRYSGRQALDFDTEGRLPGQLCRAHQTRLGESVILLGFHRLTAYQHLMRWSLLK